MLELLLVGITGAIIGGLSIWFYYRDKFKTVLNELEDKKLIIKTIHDHADQIERENVKQFAREHNAKVAKKEKTATKKPRKNAAKK